MWRSILAVVLVPSLMWSQEPSSSADKLEGLRQALRQHYVVRNEWQTMRRGMTGTAIVRFRLAPGYVVSPNEKSRDLVPLKLELEESDGVIASLSRFQSDQQIGFAFHDESIRKPEVLAKPNDSRPRVLSPVFEVQIKLKASRKAGLGLHLLRGKITYQPILDEGALPPQQMEFNIPVTIVDKDTIALKGADYQKKLGFNADSGSDSLSRSQRVGLILLSPALVVYFILESLICMMSFGQNCACD